MGHRDETLPINHSTGSHIITTAGGAAGGALKGGLKGAGAWLGITSIGGAVGWGAFGALAATAVTFFTGGVALAPVLITAGIFGVAGAIASPIVTAVTLGPVMALFTGIGGLIGGFKGAERGHEQVRQDRAAAHMVDAEVGAMQAQAMAMQAQAHAIGATRQGAPTLPTTVYADSIENQGRVAGEAQLARA